MMGRREGGQGQFFYSFDLDKVVPPDHLVRQIDGVLDLGWVHKELAPYYSHTGRPSIDPVLMIRMLIVGYVFAIRSERRLCAEVQVNLAYRWFCQLGIEDGLPDHSVFCRARRERFRESNALRRVFEGVVAKCIAAGLVGGLGVAPGANIGPDGAVFEATHGSAPKYKGQNKVNPTALILSGMLMLRHLKETAAADRLEQAVAAVIAEGKFVTYDLKPNRDDPTAVGTQEMAAAICRRL